MDTEFGEEGGAGVEVEWGKFGRNELLHALNSSRSHVIPG